MCNWLPCILESSRFGLLVNVIDGLIQTGCEISQPYMRDHDNHMTCYGVFTTWLFGIWGNRLNLKVSFSNWLNRTLAWALVVKLLSGEWHRTTLVPSQDCFRHFLGVVRKQSITRTKVDPDLCQHIDALGSKLKTEYAHLCQKLGYYCYRPQPITWTNKANCIESHAFVSNHKNYSLKAIWMIFFRPQCIGSGDASI